MKSLITITAVLYFLMPVIILFFVQICFAQIQPGITINLNEHWKFREEGKENWYPAEIPGNVHIDLLNNKLIGDPFFRDNEKKLQWIGKTNWEYQSKFTVGESLLNRQNVELVFKGLDTYASIFLNERKILEADNMFREWRVDCKKFIKSGSNTIKVVFRSPVNEILPVMEKVDYQLPAANDQGEKTSPYTRKAPYHFGWDWGPRFVTCGIWKPILLEAWDAARITDVQVIQKNCDETKAQLCANVELQSDSQNQAMLIIKSIDQKFSTTEQPVQLVAGENLVTINFEINDPELWWSNGLGAQPLYNLETILTIDGKELDRKSTRIGIRTVELRQIPDRWGESFEFVVNGVPVFAKGGNWIPADNFLNRVTKERYRHLIQSCKDANMNMLRVWGGGIYENEEFYDLCDEMGIMVWQDFMFACSMYPGNEAFLENVKQEAIYNIRRLRNHPSIVLWCGNNEIESAWLHWGWKDRLPEKLWDDYKKIFHQILPQACLMYDPVRPYWPSSPSSNFKDNSDSQNMGDMHFWGVWHASNPFSEYENQLPRFMSEYGFQSFPDLQTVNAYTLSEDHDIDSPVMTAHQKHPRGNQLIREYMLRDYKQPKDFTSFLYLSQVLQAEGIKIGAEHLRRIMPRCMGSLYWQINDTWPVASWSGIDYFGRWKALHYYAKKFYNDILLSINEEGDKIKIYIVSDRVEKMPAQLSVGIMDFTGNNIFQKTCDVILEPLSSRVYLSFSKKELLKNMDKTEVFLTCKIQSNDSLISRNSHFFAAVKDLKLPDPNIEAKYISGDNGITIELFSNKLARNVYLSCNQYKGFFTDNFFDICPKENIVIKFKSDEMIDVDMFRENIKIISLIDAFK